MSLFERVTSGFPLSISTALAFESLFPPRQTPYDPEREIPQVIDVSQYSQLWINLDTLFRNIVEAADKISLMNTGYKEASAVLYDEMETIINILSHEGRGVMTPIFYLCDYKTALSSLPKAFTLRQKTTPHAIFLEDLRVKTMKEIKRLRSDIKVFPGSIRAAGRHSALMLTHIPYDLLSRRMFEKLHLLESNTGRLKTPLQWNTKYYPVPSADMKILPFNRMLLMSLGDKQLIAPWPIKLRKQIIETARKGKWTPATTKEKVSLDLRLTLHPIDFAYLEQLKTNA